jgi:hypothetical protein
MTKMKKRNKTTTKRTERFSLDDNTCTGVGKGSFPFALCISGCIPLLHTDDTNTHTHTHTLNESGHVQSPTTLECFFSSLTARPPCLAALLVLLLPHVPTTTTNQNKQTRHSKAQDSRQAGEQEDRKSTSLAYFSFPTSSFYAG